MSKFKEIAGDILIGLVVVAILAASGLYIYGQMAQKQQPLGSKFVSNAPVNILGTHASSTLYYALEATTTKMLDMGAATDHVDLNIYTTSTAATTLTIMPAFSNHYDCASTTDTAVTWYDQSIAGISGTTVTLTASTTYSISLPASNTKGINIGFDNLAAKCMRLIFAASDASTAHVNIWANAILKDN